MILKYALLLLILIACEEDPITIVDPLPPPEEEEPEECFDCPVPFERNENIVVAQLWMEVAIRKSMEQEGKRWDEGVKIYERAYPLRIGREA